MHLSALAPVLLTLTSCAVAWDFLPAPWGHPLMGPAPMGYAHMGPSPMEHPRMGPTHLGASPMAYPFLGMQRHEPAVTRNPWQGPWGKEMSMDYPPSEVLRSPSGAMPGMPWSGANPQWPAPARTMPFFATRNAAGLDLPPWNAPAENLRSHKSFVTPSHYPVEQRSTPRDVMAAILLAAAQRSHPLLTDGRNAVVSFDGERAVRAVGPVPLDSGSHTKLELMIIERILKFKSKMNASQPDLGLPPLDPFVLDKYTFHVQNSTMQISGQLEDARVVGLSMFQVEKLKLYLVQQLAVVTVSLPKVELETGYNITYGSWFTPLKIPFYGAGKLRLTLGPIAAAVRAEVFVQDKQLSMKSLSIEYSFGDIKCAVEQHSEKGTFSDNPHLEQVLSRLVVDLMPRVASDWRPALEKQVALRLDEELKNLNWKDIFENFN